MTPQEKQDQEKQQYYIRRRGRIMGPLPLSRVKELRARGRLGATDEISTDRINWQKLQDLERPKAAAAAESVGIATAGQPSAAKTADESTPVDQQGDWYCYVNGRQVGPLSTNSVRMMIREGQLGRDDLVWREGMSEWLALKDVPELSRGAGARPSVPSGGAGEASSVAAGELIGGSFWARAGALIIDTFILLPIHGLVLLMMSPLLLVGIGVSAATALEGNVFASFGLSQFWLWITQMINVAVWLLYYAWMESSGWQATVGKKAVGLMVTDEEGRRLTFVRALGRNFCKQLSGALLSAGFLAAAFTRRKQALHDLMAACLVVNEQDLERWKQHVGQTGK